MSRPTVGLWLSLVALCGVVASLATPPAEAAKPEVVAHPGEDFHFLHMIAETHYYADPLYLELVETVKPEVVQVGEYGAHYYSLVHISPGTYTPIAGQKLPPGVKDYPWYLPIRDKDKCQEWYRDFNKKLHDRGVKVMGQINLKLLPGEMDSEIGPQGFFKFYADLWDEKALGPKPTDDVMKLLEVNRDGSPLASGSPGAPGAALSTYWGCFNSPEYKAVLKAWVKRAIDLGVDGLMTNYFYRHDCHCEHCVAGFKQHLRENFTPEQIKTKFEIADLDKHEFEWLGAWHNPAESTPLKREILRWSQIASKKSYDEVFIDYGRSLKPDLMIGVWGHLSYFSMINGDERTLLPDDLWGRGESVVWYSNGGRGTYTDLDNHWLGEGTLQARWLRNQFHEKPFTLGKYEPSRLRVTIAELAANGGQPMGQYVKFGKVIREGKEVKTLKFDETFDVMGMYYGFMTKLAEVFRDNQSYAEVLLLLPRQGVYEDGNVANVERFKTVGNLLLDNHVLFDIRSDDRQVSSEEDSKYKVIIDVTKLAPRENVLKLLPKVRSNVDLPWTTRFSASRPHGKDNEITLHLVNYNHTELPMREVKGKPGDPPTMHFNGGVGPEDEMPIAVPSAPVHFVLPEGVQVKSATAHSPEWDKPVTIEVENKKGVAHFTVPEFLVYAVVRLETEPAQ